MDPATPTVLFVLPPSGCDLVLLMHQIRSELHPRLRRIVFGGVAAAPHLFVEVEESLDEAGSLALAAIVETLSTGLRCSIARATQIKRLPPRNEDTVGNPSKAVSMNFHEAFPRDKTQNLLQYYHGVDLQKSDHKTAVFSDALCASMAFEDLRASTNLAISYIQSSNDVFLEPGGESLGITALQIKRIRPSTDFEITSALREKSLWGRVGETASLLNLLARFDGFLNLIIHHMNESKGEATAIFDDSLHAHLAFASSCVAEFSRVDKAGEALEDLRSLTNLRVEFVDGLTGNTASKQPAQASVNLEQSQHQQPSNDLSGPIKGKFVQGKAAKKKKRQADDGKLNEMEMQTKELSSDGVEAVAAGLKSLEQPADEKSRPNSAKKSSEKSTEDRALGSASVLDQPKGDSDDHNENTAPSEQSSRNKNKSRKPTAGKKGKAVNEKASAGYVPTIVRKSVSSSSLSTAGSMQGQSVVIPDVVKEELAENEVPAEAKAASVSRPEPVAKLNGGVHASIMDHDAVAGDKDAKLENPLVADCNSTSSSDVNLDETPTKAVGNSLQKGGKNRHQLSKISKPASNLNSSTSESNTTSKTTRECRMTSSKYCLQFLRVPRTDAKPIFKHIDVVNAAKLCSGYEDSLETKKSSHLKFDSPESGKRAKDQLETALGTVIHAATAQDYERHAEEISQKTERQQLTVSPSDASLNTSPETSPDSTEKASESGPLVTSAAPLSQKVTDVLLIKLDKGPQKFQYGRVTEAAKLCQGFMNAFEARKLCFMVFDSKDAAKHARTRLVKTLKLVVEYSDLGAMAHAMKGHNVHARPRSVSQRNDSARSESAYQSVGSSSDDGRFTATFAPPSFSQDASEFNGNNSFGSHSPGRGRGFGRPMSQYSRGGSHSTGEPRPYLGNRNSAPTLRDQYQHQRPCWTPTNPSREAYNVLEKNKLSSGFTKSGLLEGGPDDEDGDDMAVNISPSYQAGRGSGRVGRGSGRSFFWEQQRRNPCDERRASDSAELQNRYPPMNRPHPQRTMEDKPAPIEPVDEWKAEPTGENTGRIKDWKNIQTAQSLSPAVTVPDDEWKSSPSVEIKQQKAPNDNYAVRASNVKFNGARNAASKMEASGLHGSQQRVLIVQPAIGTPDDEWGSSPSSQVTSPQFSSGKQVNLQPRNRPELAAAVDIPDDEWNEEAQNSPERSHLPPTKNWNSYGGRNRQKTLSQERKPVSFASSPISAPVNEWGREDSSTPAFSNGRTHPDQSHPQSLSHREKHLHQLNSQNSASPDHRERSASANMRRDFGSYTEQPKHGSYQHSSFYQQNQNVRYHPNSPQTQNTQSQPSYSTPQHQKRENQLHNGVSNYSSSYRGPMNTSPASSGSEKRQIVRASAPKMGSPGDRVHDTEVAKLPPNEYGGGFSRN
ncbi:hypothetical protein HDU78_006708 [Chytriomyces hyalinus]|nr:hypothetical protein HDU78_006708 [Chytriomyces hyalinus]